MNKFLAIGRCGQDPEMKTMPDGTKLAKVSLATSKKFKDKAGQDQEKTQWHNLVFWGKRAEVIEKYIQKGKQLFVEGEIEYQEHEGKKYTQIVVREFLML